VRYDKTIQIDKWGGRVVGESERSLPKLRYYLRIHLEELSKSMNKLCYYYRRQVFESYAFQMQDSHVTA